VATGHEVVAIRFGTVTSSRSQLFYNYGLYGEEDAVIAMDYFFWVIRNDRDVILVDTGFQAVVGRRRGRTPLIDPLAALAALGISKEQVSQIVITHLHYDHIGNLAAFPEAAITIQRREVDFWTSPDAKHPQIEYLVEPSEIEYVREEVETGRMRCVDGDSRITSGVRVELVGGHSPGQQIVIVDGARRPIVIASDALHFYEELERDMPFGIFTDLVDTYRAYGTLRSLEEGGAVVVAGHDPSVMTRFETMGRPGEHMAVLIG